MFVQSSRKIASTAVIIVDIAATTDLDRLPIYELVAAAFISPEIYVRVAGIDARNELLPHVLAVIAQKPVFVAGMILQVVSKVVPLRVCDDQGEGLLKAGEGLVAAILT